MNNSLTTSSCSIMIRRNPPFTKLETLSKTKVWLVTCWPFFLAVLVLLLDTDKSIHTSNIEFSPSHCMSPLECYTRSNVNDDNDDIKSVSIIFTLPTQAILIHFVNIVGSLKFFLPVVDDEKLVGREIDMNYKVVLNLYTLDEYGQRSQSIYDNYNAIDRDVNVIIKKNEDNKTTRLRGEMFEYDYELGSASMERPWLLPQSRKVQGEVLITVAMNDQSNDNGLSLEQKNYMKLMMKDFDKEVLYGTMIDFEYQRELFTSTRALLQLIVSVVTLMNLLDYIRRIRKYHQVLYEHSILPIEPRIFHAHVDISPSSVNADKDFCNESTSVNVNDNKNGDANETNCYQYESLVNQEDCPKSYRSTCSFESALTSAATDENVDDFDNQILMNTEKSPAKRFSRMSFLLAEQVRVHLFVAHIL